LSEPAECNTSAPNSRPSNSTGPIKVVLNNCLVQQNVIQVHITPVLQSARVIRTILIDPVAIEGRQLCALVFHSAGPQLFNTTLIVPVAFDGRELCAPVLHSAGTDKVVLNDCLVQQNVIPVSIALLLQIPRNQYNSR
jgi:hypothetical protein